MATGALEGDDESRAKALGALVERGRGEKEIAEREARAAVQVAFDGGIKGVIGGHCCACGAARRGAARRSVARHGFIQIHVVVIILVVKSRFDVKDTNCALIYDDTYAAGGECMRRAS